MKTLVNKSNPEIRITTPEIIEEEEYYTTDGEHVYLKRGWILVDEEEPMDFEKLALEKYPIQMVAKDPFDDEDDTKEDLNEYEREAYLEGLKKGYELGRKVRNSNK